MIQRLLALLFAAILFFSCVSALKISDVSVLIPWESSGFSLFVNSTAAGSCVEWTTDAPHLVQLQYETCSSIVKVIPIKSAVEEFGEKKVSAIVSVSDGSERASCEVYLGHLHKIEMLTSARNLYLGEVDTLDIIGFDEEGNSFETLNGLQFDWKTEKITNQQKNGAIRLLPLNDVNVRLYIDPSKHANSDFISSQTIICEGLEIGQARVVVSWRSDNKIFDAVDFSVYDKFQLKPNAYMKVIPSSVFTYELYRRNMKKQMAQVTMPNPNFEWSSSLGSVGSVDAKLGVFTAKDVGITSVIAKDLNFEQNRAKGTVQVVAPVRIGFKFKPISPPLYDGYDEVRKVYSQMSENGRNLVVDVDYNVEIELFDDKNQKIQLTENIQFEVTVQTDGTEKTKLISTKQNMHSFDLKTLATGEAVLKATLVGEAGKLYSVSNSQTMGIYPRMKIAHPEANLYLPATSFVQQKYKLNANGGSTHHKWVILSSEVAGVDDHGILTAKYHGSVRVFVFDAYNVFNGDVRWVRVSQPHSLQWAPGKRETKVGSHLCLKLRMLDAHGHNFAGFDAFKVVTKIGDYNIYSEGKGVCGADPNTFEVQANKIGYTTFQASIVGLDLREEVPIVAFNPLALKVPKNNVNPIVVALGSTQPLVLTGGPVEWGNYQIYRSSHVSVKIADDEKQNDIPIARDANYNNPAFFTVTCRNFGERIVEFEVTNDIHVRDAEKTVVRLSRKIICAEPERAVLTPHSPITGEEKYESKEISPIDENASILAYHVAINSSIILKIDLFDKNGFKFSSFNSLTRNYILSNAELAHFPDSVITYDGKRFLRVGSKEGLLLSHGKILSYDGQIMKDARVLVNTPKLALTTPEIQLRTNIPIELTPKQLLLFNHPSISGEFLVSGGSDEYIIKTIPSQIISPTISGKSVLVTPKAEGDTTLLVQDARFEAHSPAKAIVSVSDVSIVEVEGPHYVELGEDIKLNIRVFDKSKREFDLSQLSVMKPSLLSHSPSSTVVEITQQKFHLYGVHGKGLGTVDVIASIVNSNGKVVRSQPFQIHVYPPIRVEPPTLVLIPGAKYQVKLTGGPNFDKNSFSFTDSEIIFSQIDKNLVKKIRKGDDGKDVPVISIDKRGVVTGVAYGKAIIRLKKSVSGQQFVSKEVEVYVVKLQTLNFPLSINMYDDSQLPVSLKSTSVEGFPVGALSVQSPYFSLTYTVEDTEVVKAHSSSQLGHAISLNAGKPGHSKMKVFVRFSHPHFDSYNLEQDILIYVVERLRLTDGCTSKILVSPHTNYKVKTNKPSTKFYLQSLSEENNQLTIGEVSGRISSGSSGESSILHARDVLTGQSLASKVEVHDPVYLGAEGSVSTIYLPLGSSKTFKYLGYTKHSEKMSSIDGIEVSYKSNMFEHLDISVDNISETIQLKALTTGNTTVELYSSTLDQSFSFKVVVMSTINPSHPTLLVGDKLQFQMTTTDSEKQGFWSSADSTILQIDPMKGVAVAKASGNAQIHFTSNSISTSSQVHVKKISSGQLSTSRKYILLNRKETSSSVYKVPVALFDQDGEYLSLDTSDLPQSLVRKLNIECQSTNSLIRVVRSEIVKDKLVCTVQQNPGAKPGDARIDTVRFIISVNDGINSFSIHTDNFYINLADVPNPKIDASEYMIGEKFTSQLTSPKIITTIANASNLIYQVGFVIMTLLLGIFIYKCVTVVGYKLAIASAGKKSKLPPPDIKFDKHESYYDSNGVKLRY